MADTPKLSHRPNIYIEASAEHGYTISEGPVRKCYEDLYQACEKDDLFRKAYTHFKAGVHALTKGQFQPLEERQLTPFCRALSGKFVCEGRETRLSIFTESRDTETIFAVQVTMRTEEGQHIDFYTRHPRQRRLFDPFLAGIQTFVNTDPEDVI